MKNSYLLVILFLFFFINMQGQNSRNIKLLNRDSFESIIDGKKVSLYTLKNNKGTITEITNYGGRVVSLWVKDKNGNYEDIVLGFSNIQGYINSKEKYFGAIIGRYANRINKGKFILNEKEYQLALNNGENHLHGGKKGYESIVWKAKQIDNQTLELTHYSKHMEEGYPGNLNIKVLYQLTDNNELKVEYWASTDQSTVINLTHHSFFNLRGAGNGTINDHLLQINAQYYTPVDKNLIPNGKISSVKNTPMDFQKLTTIGDRLDSDFDQLKYGLGYDHNYMINQKEVGHNYAAKIIDPFSGRTMEVYTNEPGIQFYGGNFLDGSIVGKNEKQYQFRSALCLETQHFPDSPNNKNFPTTVLNPEDKYYSICIYKFSIIK